MSTHTVYLIHIEPAYKGKSHYLGVTRTPSLNYRLQQHARGNGAKLLRAASTAGHKLYHVKSWGVPDYASERQYKKAGRYRLLCPACNGSLTANALANAQSILARCPQPPTMAVTNWQSDLRPNTKRQ